MSFADRITRLPRPFEPERGAEAAACLPDATGDTAALLAGAGGSSPFLRGLIEREADWLAQALETGPEAALEAELAAIPALDTPRTATEGLRTAKRRIALLTALADLAGIWPLEQVTGALTRLADAATAQAFRVHLAPELERGRVPGQGPDDLDTLAGITVLAMGKMGAGELNFSSDIDLICLFDETRFDPDDYAEARAAFVRVTRKAMATLSDTKGGYVFRTDLRLRPDASVTPVCLSMEAAERYYESVGRTWERAAYIKARPCAGDLEAGDRFLAALTPFVWRKHLDFAAIEDAHDMIRRIRDHKRLHGAGLEGHDLKLGRGGIREIEFFTQTRQLIAGGRDPSLRARGTCAGLEALAEAGWIGPDVAADLAADYRAHREVEHRLQMIADAQTHALPRDEEGFDRLAALMGLETAALRGALEARLDRVATLTEDFFVPGGGTRPAEAAALEEKLSDGMRATIARWANYPALRSARAVAIFERLKPDLLARLMKLDRPEEALSHLDGFLAGLPAGVQLFSLFEANPQLVDLVIDIASTAPGLANYLSRNAGVFDAVIGGDFFTEWPGHVALERELAERLNAAPDYEASLDAARRWAKEWHFRIGVHQLRGLIDAAEAGAQYADLACAVAAALWPCVQADFATRHGAPPGRGAAVLGMGSLGAGRLTAASDLDMIVIYDAPGDAMSDGRRPLDARQYYARLTKAFVTALTAPMAEGKLYEVDMRLRPSGRQGPVATSLDAFRNYQREEAWTWEHLALTRARPVAGAGDVAADVTAFRAELLAAPRDEAQLREDVRDMRRRLAEAKPGEGVWDAKNGPGRMLDIELLAQAAALLSRDAAQDVAAQIGAGRALGWIGEAEADTLLDAYALSWRLQSAARLLTGDGLDPARIGQGGTSFLLRETGADDLPTLEERIEEAATRAATIVSEALERPAPAKKAGAA